MQRKEVTRDLEKLAFEFFYWFLRFEFALKENGYLKNDRPGSKAEPSWDKFTKKFENDYVASPAAVALIAAKPQQQVVADWGGLDRFLTEAGGIRAMDGNGVPCVLEANEDEWKQEGV